MVNHRITARLRLFTFLISTVLICAYALAGMSAHASASGYVSPDLAETTLTFKAKNPKVMFPKAYGERPEYYPVLKGEQAEAALCVDKVKVYWGMYDVDPHEPFKPMEDGDKFLPGGLYGVRVYIKSDYAYEEQFLEVFKKYKYASFEGVPGSIKLKLEKGDQKFPRAYAEALFRVPGDPVGEPIDYFKQYGLQAKGYVWARAEALSLNYDRMIRYNWNTINEAFPNRYGTKLQDAFAEPEEDYHSGENKKMGSFALQRRLSYPLTPSFSPGDYKNYRNGIFDCREVYPPGQKRSSKYYLSKMSSYYLLKNKDKINAAGTWVGYDFWTGDQNYEYQVDNGRGSYTYSRVSMNGYALPVAGRHWAPIVGVHVANFKDKGAIDDRINGCSVWAYYANPYGMARWNLSYKDKVLENKKVSTTLYANGTNTSWESAEIVLDSIKPYGKMLQPTRPGYNFLYWTTFNGDIIDVKYDAPGMWPVPLFAEWEPADTHKVTVTFKYPDNFKGGKVLKTRSVYYGRPIGAPPVLQIRPTDTIDGQPVYFAGWEYDENAVAGATDYEVDHKDVTVTAKIVPYVKVTVDEGKGLRPYQVTYKPHSWFKKFTPYMTNPYAGFTGWTYCQDRDANMVPDPGKSFNTFIWSRVQGAETLLGDFSAYAKANYYVQKVGVAFVDDKRKQLFPTQFAKNFDGIADPGVPPVDSGKVFQYWAYKDKDRNLVKFEFGNAPKDLPKGDILNLYPVTKEGPATAMVDGIIDPNNGGSSKMGSFAVNSTIDPNELKAPANPNGTFEGYYDEEGTPVDQDYVVTKEFKATAFYSPKQITLTFVSADGSKTYGEFTGSANDFYNPAGGQASPDARAAKDGPGFFGWKAFADTGAVAKGAKANFVKPYTSELKPLKSLFQADDGTGPLTPEKITLCPDYRVDSAGVAAKTIAFDSNGGSYVAPEPIDRSDLTTGRFIPTKPGKRFLGWFEGDKQVKEVVAPSGDRVLTAKWEDDPTAAKIKVHFKPDLGTLKDTTLEIFVGDKVAAPAYDKPQQVDGTFYEFTGWIDLESKSAFAPSETFTKETTFMGTWKPVKVMVTLDANGGKIETNDPDKPAAKTTLELLKGDYLNAPVPTRDGYAFDGWTVEPGKFHDFTKPVMSDLTLVAQWSLDLDPSKQVTVTFDPNGGTFDDETDKTQTVAVGSTIQQPGISNGEKHFVAWKTADGKTWEFKNDVVEEDMTLKAEWSDTPASPQDLHGVEDLGVAYYEWRQQHPPKEITEENALDEPEKFERDDGTFYDQTKDDPPGKEPGVVVGGDTVTGGEETGSPAKSIYIPKTADASSHGIVLGVVGLTIAVLGLVSLTRKRRA